MRPIVGGDESGLWIEFIVCEGTTGNAAASLQSSVSSVQILANLSALTTEVCNARRSLSVVHTRVV